MTEKQSNRFTDFSFGLKYDREVRWKKTKNGFLRHDQIYQLMNRKSYQLLNQRTTFCLTRVHMTLQNLHITLLTIFYLGQKEFICIYTHFHVSKIYESKLVSYYFEFE